MPILRILGAIVLGLLAGGIVVFVVQLLGLFVYPIPEGFDGTDPKQFEDRIVNAPPLAKAVVWVAWTLGALGGTWLTTQVTGPAHRWWGLVIGLGITGGALSVLLKFPGQGLAMWILGLTLPLAASFVICSRAGRKAPA